MTLYVIIILAIGIYCLFGPIGARRSVRGDEAQHDFTGSMSGVGTPLGGDTFTDPSWRACSWNICHDDSLSDLGKMKTDDNLFD